MTHTQNSLSFEQALIDGILCIKDGCQHVLAGAADEMENELYNINTRLNNQNLHLGCGASFFILSAENNDSPSINLVDVGSFGLIDEEVEVITDFLDLNNLSANEVDLVLYSSSNQNTLEALNAVFCHSELFDYQQISGTYFTNSAFAMHYGIDILLQGKPTFLGKKIRRVLICNNLIPENLGLILIDANIG